jgi:hypothetical protein
MKASPNTYRGNPSPMAIVENKLSRKKELARVRADYTGLTLEWYEGPKRGLYRCCVGSLQHAVDSARRFGLNVDWFVSKNEGLK